MASEQKLTVCPLRSIVLLKPDHILLQDGALNYRAVLLDTWVTQYQQAMTAQGLVKGDKLVVITSDSLKVVLLAIACLRNGVIFCPLNPAMPLLQIHHYCLSIQSTWLCLIPEMLSDDWGVYHYLKLPIKQLTAVMPRQSVAIDPEQIMNLIATSGTINKPKAVAHNFSHHYYSAVGAAEVVPLTYEDVWLLSLPLFHVSGLAIIFRCLLAGACIAAYDKSKGLTSHLVPATVTHLSLVNAQLHSLLNTECLNLRDLGVTTILLGGGTVSSELVAKLRHQGVRVITTYGMTEMSSQICTGEPQDSSSLMTSGSVLTYREVMINKRGEILVRGKTLAMGYYRDGYLRPFTDALGWYHTGDKGQWYGNHIVIKGRSDNMIISGGENIHPEEIEQVLLELADIVEAVVLAANSLAFGQVPVAYVQTASGVLDESFIKQLLASRMVGFKIPRFIKLFPPVNVYSGIKANRRLFQRLLDEKICADKKVSLTVLVS